MRLLFQLSCLRILYGLEAWSPHLAQHLSRCTPSRHRTTLRRDMALVPLQTEDLQDLLVVDSPSGAQYAVYWGRTKREKYYRLLESSVVTILGLFFAYFMSFVVGSFVATIVGALFAFWAVLSPELKARQRNWEFLGGRPLIDPWKARNDVDENKQGLYGSLFLGRVKDVCVVENANSREEYPLEDFDDYRIDGDEMEQIAGLPYMLRLQLTDDNDRELQVHAQLSEEYIEIMAGMPAACILLSTSQSFSSLAALSDVMVPDADAWVGDYPYLNREELESLLAEDDEIWDTLQAQVFDFDEVADVQDTNGDMGYYDSDEDRSTLVPVRRRRG